MKFPLTLLSIALVLGSSLALSAAERFATVADPDGFTNLRAANGEILGRVTVGDPFVLLEHDKAGKRWQVRLLSGLGGYIHESRIRPLSNEEAERGKSAMIARLPRAVDPSVAGITWLDVDSAERVLGKKIRTVEEDGGFPTAWYRNAAGTEQLALTQHYGGLVNDFAEYSVRAVKGAGRGPALARIQHFTTGRGVRLGISEKELVALLGPASSTRREQGLRVLEYRVNRRQGEAAGDLLRDWQLYFGRYHFRDDRLEHFEFRFEYP